MSFRMIEIAANTPESVLKVRTDLEESRCLRVYELAIGKGRKLFKALLRTEDTQAVIDRLAHSLVGPTHDYELTMLPVTVAIPRVPEEELDAKHEGRFQRLNLVSREELQTTLEGSTEITGAYLWLVALSTVVAGIGLIENSTEVIIGAMVIAPLLGPSIAAALATCLGDLETVGRSLLTQACGMCLAFVLSLLVGYASPVLLGDVGGDGLGPKSVVEVDAIRDRTQVRWTTIVLAAATGAAGALAFGSGTMSVLVGVMVAIALLPPLATCAILLGVGEYHLAYRAFLLVATNVVSLNFAATATFLVLRVIPSRTKWWEGRKATRVTRIALAVWFSGMAGAAALLYLGLS